MMKNMRYADAVSNETSPAYAPTDASSVFYAQKINASLAKKKKIICGGSPNAALFT